MVLTAEVALFHIPHALVKVSLYARSWHLHMEPVITEVWIEPRFMRWQAPHSSTIPSFELDYNIV